MDLRKEWTAVRRALIDPHRVVLTKQVVQMQIFKKKLHFIVVFFH